MTVTGQSNFQLDEIEENKIVLIGEDTTKQYYLCAHYGEIEDKV
jgi:hypothetical protein